MTWRGRITTRRIFRLFRNNLFNRQVLVNNAENVVTNPMEMSHGVAIHAISNPRLLIGSCILIGIIAEVIISVPTHIWNRKIGCDAFTTTLSRYRKVQIIQNIDVTITNPHKDKPKANIAVGIKFKCVPTGGKDNGGVVVLLKYTNGTSYSICLSARLIIDDISDVNRISSLEELKSTINIFLTPYRMFWDCRLPVIGSKET